MPGPEKNFENALRKALEKGGALVVKLHGSRFQIRGLPDLMVICPDGIVRFVEVKSLGAVQCTKGELLDLLSRSQALWLAKAAIRRAPCFVAAGGNSDGKQSGFAARYGGGDEQDRALEWMTVAELATEILNTPRRDE